jgi:hypothetical protein
MKIKENMKNQKKEPQRKKEEKAAEEIFKKTKLFSG